MKGYAVIATSKYRDTFPKRLQALMTRKRVSVYEMAADTGITNSTIYGYLKGRTYPAFDIILEIADYFGVTMDELAGRNRNGKWELYDGEGARMWRCSLCGNKVGPMLKDRNYCEKCGSMNGGIMREADRDGAAPRLKGGRA